jgi:hypothetical protein
MQYSVCRSPESGNVPILREMNSTSHIRLGHSSDLFPSGSVTKLRMLEVPDSNLGPSPVILIELLRGFPQPRNLGHDLSCCILFNSLFYNYVTH